MGSVKMGGFSVEDIATMQTADVNTFADVIYFRGCSRCCEYCFNRELACNTGNNMNTFDILKVLYTSPSRWVVLSGGEPLEQNLLDLKDLIDKIHDMGKKVCVLTSYPDPWKYMNADHYHIHLNICEIDEPLPSNVSLGLISYHIGEESMETMLRNIDKNVPIYVKTCYGYEEISNAQVNALYISAILGFKKVYVDKQLEVE